MQRPTQAEALQMHKDALKTTEEERFHHNEDEDAPVQALPTAYIEGEAPPPPPPRARDHTLTGYQIIPKGTRLLVWVEEAEHITAGGILLPDIAREEEEVEEATVLAVGQGRYNADRGCFLGCNYEVGDRVWFRRTAHHLLTEIPGQKQLLLIQEDLCQAVLLKPQGDQADETESEEPDERPDHG